MVDDDDDDETPSSRSGGGVGGIGSDDSGGKKRRWGGWGMMPGKGRFTGVGAWDDQSERKSRQEEWERWRRSWSEDWTQGDGGDGSWAESDDSSTTPSGPAREIDPIRGPRDAYLRPMIDARGIRQRLAFKSQVGEEELRAEFQVNQAESQQAVSFAAMLIGVPLITGFCVSRLCAEPAFHVYSEFSPEAFALSDRQKVEGAERVHKEELRLQMDIAIGRSPPLTDDQLQHRLREEAHEIRDDFREENKQSLLNVISDAITGILISVILAGNHNGRKTLFRTIGRVFGGLSDTAKAFLIIASTDILLGYHSEEGWTAAIHLLLKHYGAEADEDASHLFVATIPVILDSFFKYWIFVGLNRRDPAAAVTLRSMDRH